MTFRPLDERGLTLTEVTIVAAIGLLVLMGLGGFYLNSQATWLDASSQSITQREATLVSEAIAEAVRPCGKVVAYNLPDADHGQIELYHHGPPGTPPHWYFWWSPADSLIHQGSNMSTDDRGAILSSKVERFRVAVSDPALVQVSMRVRAATGQIVEVSTSMTLRNR